MKTAKASGKRAVKRGRTIARAASLPSADLTRIDSVTQTAELRSVTATLRSLRDRVEATASTLLERRARAADGSQARLIAYLVQRQLWGFAGELIGVQERLHWIADGLLRPGHAASDEESDGEVVDESAELLAVIQCVIADRLNPAVEALTRACRRHGPS